MSGHSEHRRSFAVAGSVSSRLLAERGRERSAAAGLAHFAVMMKWSTAICWTFILLAALFFEDSGCKGGRGGARGAARGSARGATRRSKSSSRYGSSGTALRVAAAAAGGAAAGAAAAVAAGRLRSAGESHPENADNSTFEGSYNYRAWTSGAQSWHLVPLSTYLLCATSSFSL
nr:shadow of prion protein [Pogona vitticeps]